MWVKPHDFGQLGCKLSPSTPLQYSGLTLLDLTHEQLVHPGMDMACIPSIFIKTSHKNMLPKVKKLNLSDLLQKKIKKF